MAQKHDTPEYVDAPMTRAGKLELVASRRQIRSDAFTAVRWAAVNPILQLGEIGYETDTNKLKVGDGVTEWNDLGYVSGGGSSLPDQDGHSGEFLTTDGTDASWGAVSEVPSTTGATEGDVLTVDSNGDPAWTTPSGGGLPDQTGQSGKFLTTDGTDASWGTISALQNTATGTNSLTILGTAATAQDALNIGIGSSAGRGSTAIGQNAAATARGVALGKNATISGTGLGTASCPIAIGYEASATAAGAIQIGRNGNAGAATNSDANTFKVANANGNFEMMNANGNLPADRLASTTGLADGNYRLRLVMASGVPTLEWVAE